MIQRLNYSLENFYLNDIERLGGTWEVLEEKKVKKNYTLKYCYIKLNQAECYADVRFYKQGGEGILEVYNTDGTLDDARTNPVTLQIYEIYENRFQTPGSELLEKRLYNYAGYYILNFLLIIGFIFGILCAYKINLLSAITIPVICILAFIWTHKVWAPYIRRI